MSAKRYSICPRCREQADKDREEAIARAKRLYGKVTPDEYEAAIQSAREVVPLEDTLAEYYEIGFTDNYFVARYNCLCSECGFKFDFDHGAAPDFDMERGL